MSNYACVTSTWIYNFFLESTAAHISRRSVCLNYGMKWLLVKCNQMGCTMASVFFKGLSLGKSFFDSSQCYDGNICFQILIDFVRMRPVPFRQILPVIWIMEKMGRGGKKQKQFQKGYAARIYQNLSKLTVVDYTYTIAISLHFKLQREKSKLFQILRM